MIPGVPTWALALAVVLLLVLAFWWYQERSARGVARRSRKDSKRAAGALGVGVVGVVGTLVGVLEGGAGVVGILGELVIPGGDMLAQIGLTVLGWLALRGSVTMGATTFVAVAVLVIVLGFAVGD